MSKLPFRSALILAFCLLLLGATRAAAGGGGDEVVSDCGDTGLDTQLRAKLLLAQERNNLVITFSCAGPVVLLDGVLPKIYLDVTIDGGGTMVLSGGNAARLFEIENGGILTLNNITLTKGFADGDGGAIYSSGALTINNSRFLDNQTTLNGNGGALIAFGALTITNSEFAYNQAANGGAIYPTGARAVATITGSSFHDNAAVATNYGWGGAIYQSAGAAVTIHASTLRANRAQSGGGIYVYEVNSLTKLAVDQGSVLDANVATGIGGGITNQDGDVTLAGVTLSGNTALSGGGIYSTKGLVNLAAVTLSGNTAEFAGGGLFNTEGDATLTNVTVSGNLAGEMAAGIYNSPGDLQLTNVTLSGNSAPYAGGIFFEDGVALLKNTLLARGAAGENCVGVDGGAFSLADDATCHFGAGRDVVDLLLGALADNGGPTLTHLPQPGSLAIDAGTGAGCPAADQRGVARTGPGTGSACDVGAVEFQTPLQQLERVYLPLITPR
jgi:large repetitive protein